MCNGFGTSCLYCRQSAHHPSPQHSDWLSEDWDGDKAKSREQSKSLIGLSDPKSKKNVEQTMDIDKIPFSKLQKGQDDEKKEPLEVMDSLVPPHPLVTGMSNGTTENANEEELMEPERKLQRKEEQYAMYKRTYMGQLSDKEDSNMDTNKMSYTYFR